MFQAKNFNLSMHPVKKQAISLTRNIEFLLKQFLWNRIWMLFYDKNNILFEIRSNKAAILWIQYDIFILLVVNK